MTTATENILSTVLNADVSVSEEQRRRVFQILKGEPEEAEQAPIGKLLTRNEVAAILHKTPAMIDRYCRMGLLHKFKIGYQSRASGILEKEVREFMENYSTAALKAS